MCINMLIRIIQQHLTLLSMKILFIEGVLLLFCLDATTEISQGVSLICSYVCTYKCMYCFVLNVIAVYVVVYPAITVHISVFC